MEVFMDSRNIVNDFLGVGWKFPVEVDETTGRIRTVGYEDDVREAVYLIMMTKVGERMMQPDYGCRISDFTFETMDYTQIVELQKEIMNALILWEPRIINVDVNIEVDDVTVGKLNISLSYVVRSTNNPYNLVYPYYINEGL
jgi:phage baseplate assembly protein W